MSQVFSLLISRIRIKLFLGYIYKKISLMNFLINHKIKLSKKISTDMVRLRCNPKIYDYSFITCMLNLKTLKHVLGLARKRFGQRLMILDIGCGNKPFLDLFNKNDSYLGIDFSKDSKADIFQDLSEKFPFENNKFDLIIISECLEHLKDPISVINESKRVLNQNGYIFISTPFCLNIHGRPYDYFRYTEYFYSDLLVGNLDIELIKIFKSNSILTTPILTLNSIILVLPFIPSFIKNLLYFLNNIFSLIIELILKQFKRIKIIKNFLESLPLGYAVIYKKLS
tara:strand:+ start:16 stop:864 length:849 start_codon:yes stop_codon:yes gene_type:complete